MLTQTDTQRISSFASPGFQAGFEQLIEVLAFLSFVFGEGRTWNGFSLCFLCSHVLFLERPTSLLVRSTLLILKLLLTKRDRDHTDNSFFSPWERRPNGISNKSIASWWGVTSYYKGWISPSFFRNMPLVNIRDKQGSINSKDTHGQFLSPNPLHKFHSIVMSAIPLLRLKANRLARRIILFLLIFPSSSPKDSFNPTLG
ncbi:hypothetical protein VNO77_46224 [Canavalia gladiata]|uniref:Uncharacterized protein n=1 Tax=Canavalia gladiata TaxID=3824 RepID=A0AAN9JIN3_CANGL